MYLLVKILCTKVPGKHRKLKHQICDSATPSAPFGITMLSCDGSSMTVAWKSPKHCGGSKIKAYYIDKRDADTLVWKEVNQEAVTERTCTVSESHAF